MCTLTLQQTPSFTRIFMNRDERLDRKAERPPHIWDNGLWAPQDSAKGGTWIGVLPTRKRWACLLNDYTAATQAAPPATPLSRGEIIPRLLTGDDWNPARLDLHRYPPFRLLYGDMQTIHEAHWDGHTLHSSLPELTNGWLLRSSSSWEEKAVATYRQQVFKNWLQNPATVTKAQLPTCHLHCPPGEEASAILMQRQNPPRATVSITGIYLDQEKADLTYFSSQPEGAEVVCKLRTEDIYSKNSMPLIF